MLLLLLLLLLTPVKKESEVTPLLTTSVVLVFSVVFLICLYFVFLAPQGALYDMERYFVLHQHSPAKQLLEIVTQSNACVTILPNHFYIINATQSTLREAPAHKIVLIWAIHICMINL